MYRMLPSFVLCREGAYTCFNQTVGAEEFSYGSRIDHILISKRTHCRDEDPTAQRAALDGGAMHEVQNLNSFIVTSITTFMSLNS